MTEKSSSKKRETFADSLGRYSDEGYRFMS
jgi:hypothetical protein